MRQHRQPISEREAALTGPLALKDRTSVEYAWQMTHKLKTMFELKEVSVERWRKIVGEAERDRIFEKIPPEKPYGDINALLKAELGVGKEEADEHILARPGRPTKQEQEERNNVGNANIIGHTAAYNTARLARDRPDLHARVLSGELSPHAGAIEAGFRKRMLTVPFHPQAAARTLRKHFTADQLLAFIEALVTP